MKGITSGGMVAQLLSLSLFLAFTSLAPVAEGQPATNSNSAQLQKSGSDVTSSASLADAEPLGVSCASIERASNGSSPLASLRMYLSLGVWKEGVWNRFDDLSKVPVTTKNGSADGVRGYGQALYMIGAATTTTSVTVSVTSPTGRNTAQTEQRKPDQLLLTLKSVTELSRGDFDLTLSHENRNFATLYCVVDQQNKSADILKQKARTVSGQSVAGRATAIPTATAVAHLPVTEVVGQLPFQDPRCSKKKPCCNTETIARSACCSEGMNHVDGLVEFQTLSPCLRGREVLPKTVCSEFSVADANIKAAQHAQDLANQKLNCAYTIGSHECPLQPKTCPTGTYNKDFGRYAAEFADNYCICRGTGCRYNGGFIVLSKISEAELKKICETKTAKACANSLAYTPDCVPFPPPTAKPAATATSKAGGGS